MSHLTDTAPIAAELEGAPVYRKNVIVTARVASPGEKLVTVLANGTEETSRVLAGGEYVVTNPGGEQYAMAAAKFHDRYAPLPDGRWRATGRIRALRNPYGRDVTILASWGEEQHGDAQCWFAATLDAPTQVYLIGGDEFAGTYVAEEPQGLAVLFAAWKAALDAAWGDSNDEEISSLQELRDVLADHLPEPLRSQLAERVATYETEQG